jgi:hypothetical protein
MSEGRPQFGLRGVAITITVLCVTFGLVAAVPQTALAVAYTMLYPLAILCMVSLIVGLLVLGRFLVERLHR